MKFALSTAFISACLFAVSNAEVDRTNLGIISPTADLVISENTPLNLTIAPHRYFKEQDRFIDVFIFIADSGDGAKSGHLTSQVVSAMPPNIRVTYDGIEAGAYQVLDIDLKSIGGASFEDWKCTVMVLEHFWPYQGAPQITGLDTWHQTFTVTKN